MEQRGKNSQRLDIDLQTYEQGQFQSARVWESAAGYAQQ